MPDSLQELLEHDGAPAVLHAYGLDQVLTDEDDPWLWACVLMHHWPAPWEPDMEPAALRFGIGRAVAEGEEAVPAGRSGMEQVESWCFERVDGGHLRVRECMEVPTPSFMAMMVSGNLSAMSTPQAAIVRDYLDISRPTHRQGRALVHKGMSAPPNAGSGETRYWEQTGDGRWQEADEVYARWLT